MSRNVTGVAVVLATILVGMAVEVGPAIAAMPSWADLTTPAFVGNVIKVFGLVAGGAVGGQIYPTVKRPT